MEFLVQSPLEKNKLNHLFYVNALFLNNFESDTIISIHREFLLSSVLEISL